MFLTLDKFRQRVRELGEKRYFGHSCIAPFISMEGNLPPDESYKGLPEKVEGPAFGLHDFFVGRDRYLLSFRKQKKAVRRWVYLISGKPAADITADLNPCCMWTGTLTREWIPIIRK